MSTHLVSYTDGEEANFETARGMTVAANADLTADIEVYIQDSAIGKDAALAGLEKIIVALRKADYPAA